MEDHRARFDVDTTQLDAVIHQLTSPDPHAHGQPPTLEELFLRHYGDDVATAA